MTKFGSACDGCYFAYAIGGDVCQSCELKDGAPTKRHIIFQSKPPLGLVPRWMHDSQRVGEILEALMRYNEAGKPFPQEWLDELNEKIKKEEAK